MSDAVLEKLVQEVVALRRRVAALETLENPMLPTSIDADKLDGQHGTYYAVAGDLAAHTGNTAIHLGEGGRLVLSPGTELTIASGAITVTGSYHIVDTEGDTATDDLDTINGGVAGQLLILRSANNAREPLLRTGIGNLVLGSNCNLTHTNDLVVLFYTGTIWLKVAFSDLGP